MAHISIPKTEHRTQAYLAINPLGQTPALAFGDGPVLTERLAICRYFEALHPGPPLFSHGAQYRPDRHVDQAGRVAEMTPLGAVWLHTHYWTARFVTPQFTGCGESQRPLVIAAMHEFDHAMAKSEWLDGGRYTIADIV
jgi:glutathione S-transferase